MFNSEKILIFDGAIGTALYDRGFYINRPFEELCLKAPEDVLALHKSYIEAGADVLTTNTFSITRPQLQKFDIEEQQQELITAALALANQARRDTPDTKIAFSIGPLGVLIEPLGRVSFEEVENEFAQIATLASECGEEFDFYILETFTSVEELTHAINGIRKVDKTRPLVASLSVNSNQLKRVKKFAEVIGIRHDVQALGLNCSEGPSGLFTSLKALRPLTDKYLVVQPNAGLPRSINGRYFYMTSPDYLAKYAKRYAEIGANAVGGCCGTTPEHISAIRYALKMTQIQRIELSHAGELEAPKAERRCLEERQASWIGQKLCRGEKVISIELSPPKGVDTKGFLEKLDQIEKAGIEFINIPDGARASTRVSSLHIAAYVAQHRKNLHIVPHFTTRDRNLIALQSDLLGAYLNGVRDLLIITGDPPKLGSNKDATAVYDIDSIGLTRMVDCLNRGQSPLGDELGSCTNYGIGVASNPTAINLETERQRWKYKCEMGADFAFTQPIYEPESFFRWKDSLGADDRPHIVGIWPFVSLRNAEFMANEVPGVFVPQWALDEMAKANDDKLEAQKRGIAIAQRVMEALNDACEGFAMSAPLGKVEIALSALGKEG